MTSTETIFPVAGVRWSSCAAGIKKSGQADLALMAIDAGSTAAAVFTRNAFAAAPVQVAQQALRRWQSAESSQPLFCLVNAGNANAGTGKAGLDVARRSCDSLLAALDGAERSAGVLPFSTGVIGEPLPVEKIEAALPALIAGLDGSAEAWRGAAASIMTTDTLPKLASKRIALSSGSVVITGIAKGAGMIKPNMATMLSYIATDAVIDRTELQDLLALAVEQSFNRITVDGDTSTNDACLLAASGASGVSICASRDDRANFARALNEIFITLATAIIRDAEGASKFITIVVSGGKSREECLLAAYAVAESPLVKTAFFASDANWGRILAAVGRAGIDALDIEAVELSLDGYCICRNGARPEHYDEVRASEVMAQGEVTVAIELGRGNCTERVWTSDLSHDYVRINAEYRT